MNFFKTNFDKTVEKLLVNFLSKIRYGKLTVQFPTGEERVFIGKEEDISANIKIHNYNFLNLIFKKGSVGFAEAYMNGYFSSTDLTNLLLLSHKNESYFLQSINTNIFFATNEENPPHPHPISKVLEFESNDKVSAIFLYLLNCASDKLVFLLSKRAEE